MAGESLGPRAGPPDAAARRGAAGKGKRSAWLAEDGSKRWGEAFFLLYTPFWLTLCLGLVVPFKLYERFTELEYLVIGLVSTLPAFLIPLFIVGKADSIRSLKNRYWVKANVWIMIFSYVGNYFLTHYFFTVLVNLPVYLQWLFEVAWILALAYFIAYLETLAIANFPYYEFVDRDIMYTVGSLFYAIYFLVSFPMFSRIDEKAEKWSLSRVAIDALGAAMLVTIILDLWRIFLGPIVAIPESRRCAQPGLAWFQVQRENI